MVSATSIKTEETQHLKSDRAIRLVLDYVNSAPAEEITAVELCTLADCSQRWLEQSFKKRFGVTPKAYVKYLRLARLRRDLQQPPCGESANGYRTCQCLWILAYGPVGCRLSQSLWRIAIGHIEAKMRH